MGPSNPLPLSLINNLSEFTLAVGGEDMYMGKLVVYPFSGKLAKCLPSQQGGKDNGLHKPFMVGSISTYPARLSVLEKRSLPMMSSKNHASPLIMWYIVPEKLATKIVLNNVVL
jgi:hypothetical protein